MLSDAGPAPLGMWQILPTSACFLAGWSRSNCKARQGAMQEVFVMSQHVICFCFAFYILGTMLLLKSLLLRHILTRSARMESLVLVCRTIL